MKQSYLDFFKENIHVNILEPHGNSSEKHTMQCLLCHSEFIAVPKDRKNKFKKNGIIGCPSCARKNASQIRKKEASVPDKIKAMGYTIHEKYQNNKTPILVEKNNCCGRIWKAVPNKLLQKAPHCKPCDIDKINSNKKTKSSRIEEFQKYVDKLKNEAKLEVLPPYKTSNDKHDIKCLLCDGIFEATPKSKMANFKKHKTPGCPKCTHSRRYSSVRKTNIEKLKERFNFVEPEFFTNDTMLQVTNKVCGHTFTSKVGNLLTREVECPECGIVNRITRLQAYNEKINSLKRNSLEGLEGYSTRVRLYTERTYREFEDTINPLKLERKRSGSVEGYHLDHIVSIKECFLNNVPEELCAHVDNLRMVKWDENAEKWAHPQSNIPEILIEYFPNYKIREDFRNSFEGVECGVEIISPFVFDLYNPSTKTAVIFHIKENIVESNVGKQYCLNLLKKCADNNIRLIQVLDDEWILNRRLVYLKINHILNKGSSKKIYARKTKLELVDNPTKNEFLNNYHIQGADKSHINIGAYYSDQLVAVMTFCKPRVLMNKKHLNKEGYWELSRFATHNDFRVIGIASKLLKYFVRNYDWQYIYSFADLRWSTFDSNVYEQSGFILDKKKPTPEYHYIVDGKRMHRWGFRKDALREKFPDKFDPTKTEYENMLSIGYDRVWDCGHLKYFMKREV